MVGGIRVTSVKSEQITLEWQQPKGALVQMYEVGVGVMVVYEVHVGVIVLFKAHDCGYRGGV